jgi:PIN domain nuclease of toxin-antitoxin system
MGSGGCRQRGKINLALLIDTHVFIWWCTGQLKSIEPIYNAIADPANQVLVSAITFYEIAQKQRSGKYPPFDFRVALDKNRFDELPLSAGVAVLAGKLDYQHRDPFDRILLAESIHRNIMFATADSKILASNLASFLKVDTR